MVAVDIQIELYRVSRLLLGADASIVAVAEYSSFAASEIYAGGAPEIIFSELDRSVDYFC